MESEPSSTPEPNRDGLHDSRAEKDPSHVENGEDTGRREVKYLTGLRFYLFLVAITIALFLANLEIPIVTTSLVAITEDFHGFERGSWVISAYLLGFVAIIIIISKLSDIFGQKPAFFAALSTFMVFSGACGAAQSLNQLIIFRAFQGLGGGGCFAICTVICLDLVPKRSYTTLITFISVVYAISLIIGPILGGTITMRTTWRWIFLLNVPAAFPAVVIVFFAVPRGFPYHDNPTSLKELMSKATLQRVDFLGSALLLLATLSLVAGVEEAGLSHGWHSAFVIAMLVVSGILWIAFLFWERYITQRDEVPGAIEPVFPWRFMQNRVWMGMIINAIFLGGCWFCTIFQLPQRYQVVHGTSPLGAGIRSIPFIASAPISSAVSAAFAKKGVPPIYLVVGASALEVVGFSLLGTITPSTAITARQYGYEILAGFGCGSNISLLVLLVPFSVQPKDTSVAMGSVTQFRLMGGAVTLAIINTARNAYLKSHLKGILEPEQINAILDFAHTSGPLDPATQRVVGTKLAEGYNLQTKILAGMAGVQLLSSLLMWQKRQIKV
ncbi:MFS general substrate transporter [Bimuria novae-zelandiae CBS 107.79]|uniref:MFS general substrate transporter n=1 Tax=Bimuria novae-zelandiae CBS 107.79 TaxID=1447943 RepID=A0A6A5V9J0_9PLEO|nr:MFS general substrate transporter [Bimuria novae-zelandiae CBS 107.79]